MKSILIALFFCSWLTSQTHAPAHALAEAERAFSAASEKDGITASFVEFLDDSCVMFNPGPVNGKELYRKRKENGAYLIWSPSFVETAASGDFGISTGPWEYRRSKGDTSVSYGHYFSVWQKDRNGVWKVILDNGINYSASAKKKEKDSFSSLPQKKRPSSSAAPAAILALERSFADAAGKDSRTAYQKYSAENIHLYRKDSFPTSTKKEALQLIPADEQGRSYHPVDAKISSAGDIGFVYGYTIDQKQDTSSYVRVWMNEDQWKVAADLQEAFPQ
jgi:ketosteroid isomerase-like protein